MLSVNLRRLRDSHLVLTAPLPQIPNLDRHPATKKTQPKATNYCHCRMTYAFEATLPIFLLSYGYLLCTYTLARKPIGQRL